MTVTPAVLQPGTQLSNSAASIYTTGANGRTLVKRAVFTNVDTVTRLLTVYRVQSGGSATTGNIIINALRLAPGESYVAPELTNMVLNAGDAIFAKGDAASVINAFMSGFNT